MANNRYNAVGNTVKADIPQRFLQFYWLKSRQFQILSILTNRIAGFHFQAMNAQKRVGPTGFSSALEFFRHCHELSLFQFLNVGDLVSLSKVCNALKVLVLHTTSFDSVVSVPVMIPNPHTYMCDSN